jgi:hypothetical protein
MNPKLLAALALSLVACSGSVGVVTSAVTLPEADAGVAPAPGKPDASPGVLDAGTPDAAPAADSAAPDADVPPPPPPPADAAPVDAGPPPPPPPARLETLDGGGVYHDRLLNFDCGFATVADGTVRCFPHNTPDLSHFGYSDAACTARMIVYSVAHGVAYYGEGNVAAKYTESDLHTFYSKDAVGNCNSYPLYAGDYTFNLDHVLAPSEMATPDMVGP